jgi:hypothetical protein
VVVQWGAKPTVTTTFLAAATQLMTLMALFPGFKELAKWTRPGIRLTFPPTLEVAMTFYTFTQFVRRALFGGAEEVERLGDISLPETSDETLHLAVVGQSQKLIRQLIKERSSRQTATFLYKFLTLCGSEHSLLPTVAQVVWEDYGIPLTILEEACDRAPPTALGQMNAIKAELDSQKAQLDDGWGNVVQGLPCPYCQGDTPCIYPTIPCFRL